LEVAEMTLKYGELVQFTRENGDVKAWAEKGAVTLSKNGNVDSVAFFETDAVRFEHLEKSYTRAEFEKLLRSKLKT
jgi:hypothetical protein